MRYAMVFSMLMMGLSACKQDACKDVLCTNGGTCVDGNCVCVDGYEGFNCETEQRLAFVGTYSVEESCNLGNFSYSIVISANSSVGTELTISNVGDFDEDITAIVSGTDITIVDQAITGSTVNGTGQLIGNILTIDYVLITTSGQTLSCTMTCTLNQ